MLKRLGLIFGPVIVAVVAVIAGIMLMPEDNNKHDYQAEQRAANALTPIVFKNQTLKQRALSDKQHRFVPFFGSSEWSRMDTFHPSVLAEGYHRSYRPFLLGQRGAQSLTQYFGMQQITKQLTNKQAVYVISPQWFVKQGEDPNAFKYYFNQAQALTWLQHAKGTTADRYAAKRLLAMNVSSSLTGYLRRIADGKKLTANDQGWISMKLRFLNHEDSLFSDMQLGNNYTKRVLPKTANLPKTYNETKLNALADKYAAEHTKSNQFGIDDKFYQQRVAKQLGKLRGSQRQFNYLQSPEYGDLQLALQQFAATHTNVLFVIQPVNEKWAAYTGLDMKMYDQTVAKIKSQLTTQGFTNIADFSQSGDKQYFMQDTIHMGWRGWLAFDKRVNHFLTTPQSTPTYHMQDKYYGHDWMMATSVN
jgi:D-alanine transfer protein